MPVRLISEADVDALVTMQDALDAVERSLLEQGQGTAINQPRRRVHQPAGVLHLMSGAMLAQGYWGYKAYTTTRQGARFTVALYSSSSGALLALIEANRLGQLRTGAASGIATRYLARPEAQIMALFGTGFQAETQLVAIATAFPLRQVRVYGRDAERRAAFATRLQAQVGIAVLPVATPTAALDGADIITTMTSAREPVFDGNLLREGMHINAAGSNSAAKAELDPVAVGRCTRIFADDVEQARLESGDLILAYERNALNWGRVRPLGEVVAGNLPGRTTPTDITLFESHGLAIWDVALAGVVYERALAQNRGTLVEFGDI